MTTAVTSQQLVNAGIDTETIAAIANSDELTVTDRLGNTKPTMAGVRASTFYAVPVAFTSSISVTTTSQTVEYNGVVYAAIPSELPFTTTGSFNSSQWYPIQDTRSYLHRTSKANLSAIAVASVSAGDLVSTEYRSNAGDNGGGLFIVTKSDISTECAADAQEGIYIPFDASPGDGSNGGFIRQFNGDVYPEWFGAVGNGSTDDRAAIQGAIDSGYRVKGQKGKTYSIEDTLVMGDGHQLTSMTITMGGTRADFTIAGIINENYNDTTGNTDILIEDVDITGFSDTQQTDGTSISGSNIAVAGVYLQYVKDCVVRNVKTNETGSGVTVYLPPSGIDSAEANNLVENCIVIKAQGYSQTGNAGTPRGIYMGTGGILRNNYTDLCATGYYIDGDGTKVVANEAHNWYKDDGFYLVGTRLKVTLNRAIGTLGNGFAIAYNEDSIVTNNYAYGCTNMGYRIHAPQSNTTISNNVGEYCGYGARIENSVSMTISSITRSGTTATATTSGNHSLLTGRFAVIAGADQSEYNGVYPVIKTGDTTFTYTVSGSPATPATGTITGYYTSQGINLSDNQFNNNDLCGIQVSYFVNSIIKGNRCFENNQDGVGSGTRGGISIAVYCINNEINTNKCYDYQATPTQTYGFYNYDKASSGAEVENSGNRVTHKSETGTDYFGVEPVFGLTGTGSPEGVVDAAPCSTYYNLSGGSGTTLYVKQTGTGNTGWAGK